MSTTETPSKRLPCVACSYADVSSEGSVVAVLAAIQHGGGQVFMDLVDGLCDRHGSALDGIVDYIQSSINWMKLKQKLQQSEPQHNSKSN
jgi:hypothetical protein